MTVSRRGRFEVTSRREFLKVAAASGSALSLAWSSSARGSAGHASGPLRILILGGTGFIGPYQVRYAVERGHHVTVFNRGRRRAELPDSVVQLRGDRDSGDLKSLEGKTWDVVIDNPTTLPFWVRDAAAVLGGAVRRYAFISTISVYAEFSRGGMDEDTPLLRYTGRNAMAETTESLQRRRAQLYGPLKAVSEATAERAFPGRTTIIRPGLIVGPGDDTDRFTYWPARIDRGGETLAPGAPDHPAQIIDARDLAEWTIRMVEQGEVGAYNATGPASALTIGQLLAEIRAATSSPATFTWVPADFLREHNVRGWSDMPVWVPPAPDNAGFLRMSIARALAKGLTFRPLSLTTRDTLTWHKSRPLARQQNLLAGLTPDRERALLNAWRAPSPRERE